LYRTAAPALAHGNIGVLTRRYKDDNGIDAVASRLPALELALASLFGQSLSGRASRGGRKLQLWIYEI